MSFSDPGFEEMSFEELKEWLASNDLSGANYAELVQQLGVDLPSQLPGVVQSSIGGSTTTAPSQGSTLVWDAAQQLYVPSVTITSGSGAPTGGSSGSYYFRTDTPGTTNQRIYVNNAGTWTGIL